MKQLSYIKGTLTTFGHLKKLNICSLFFKLKLENFWASALLNTCQRVDRLLNDLPLCIQELRDCVRQQQQGWAGRWGHLSLIRHK